MTKKTEKANMETLKSRMHFYKEFLLNSNEKIHTNTKGVMMVESLTMNNFIIDWFNDLEEGMEEFIWKLKEELIRGEEISYGWIGEIIDKHTGFSENAEVSK